MPYLNFQGLNVPHTKHNHSWDFFWTLWSILGDSLTVLITVAFKYSFFFIVLELQQQCLEITLDSVLKDHSYGAQGIICSARYQTGLL